MKKSNDKKTSKKSPKWVLRLLVFVGRALLLLADYLDDCQINGSSLEMFERVKNMFSLPDDKDEEEQTIE